MSSKTIFDALVVILGGNDTKVVNKECNLTFSFKTSEMQCRSPVLDDRSRNGRSISSSCHCSNDTSHLY